MPDVTLHWVARRVARRSRPVRTTPPIRRIRRPAARRPRRSRCLPDALDERLTETRRLGLARSSARVSSCRAASSGRATSMTAPTVSRDDTRPGGDAPPWPGRSIAWRSASRVTTTAGVRVDHHSVFGTAVSPKLAANCARRRPVSRLRASYGGGFRAPDLGQLYYRFLNPTNFYQVIGNPEPAARSLRTRCSLAASTSSSGRRARLGVNVFRNDVHDLIESVNLGFVADAGAARRRSWRAKVSIRRSARSLGRLFFTLQERRTTSRREGVELDGEVAVGHGVGWPAPTPISTRSTQDRSCAHRAQPSSGTRARRLAVRFGRARAPACARPSTARGLRRGAPPASMPSRRGLRSSMPTSHSGLPAACSPSSRPTTSPTARTPTPACCSRTAAGGDLSPGDRPHGAVWRSMELESMKGLIHPRGFAPRTPRHALSRAASSARLPPPPRLRRDIAEALRAKAGRSRGSLAAARSRRIGCCQSHACSRWRCPRPRRPTSPASCSSRTAGLRPGTPRSRRWPRTVDAIDAGEIAFGMATRADDAGRGGQAGRPRRHARSTRCRSSCRRTAR